MGHSHSKSKELFLSVLGHMLEGRGSKVSKNNLNEFYEFLLKVSPWFPEEGSLSLQNWKRVGREMRRYYETHGPGAVPIPTFSIWIQIRDLLTDKTEMEFLIEETPSIENKEKAIPFYKKR